MSLPLLIAEFLAVVAAVAGVLAVAFALTDRAPDAPTLLEWWKDMILYVLSFPPDDALIRDVGAGQGVLQLIAAVAGLVLPALFVGAIVLKLFISPDLFTMRNKVVMLPNGPDDPRLRPGGYHLAVRGYSSTQFRLLNVTFSAVIRFEQPESDGTTLLLHRPLRVANPSYAIARPHVPYTLTIPIDDDDWAGEPGGELACLQGFPLAGEAVVIVLIEGRIPELSSEFTEAHDFPITTTMSTQPYAGLAVDYDRPSSEWEGWESFDER